MVNIFLAILNDAYIAIKMQFDAEEQEESAPPLSIGDRIELVRAWLRQRRLDKRIEELRKQQRRRELHERRAQRRVEEMRSKTLKAMGIDPNAKQKSGGGKNGASLEVVAE